MFDIAGIPARDEVRAVRDRERQRLYRFLYRAVGGRRCALAPLAGGGELALRQPVDFVVLHQFGDVGVAADRVGEVSQALAVAVAIPVDEDDAHIPIRQLDALSDGPGTSVQGVKAVHPRVLRELAPAADAGDDDQFMGRDVLLDQGTGQRRQDAVIATPCTPGGADIAFVVITCDHQSTSLMPSRMYCGRKGRPSKRRTAPSIVSPVRIRMSDSNCPV